MKLFRRKNANIDDAGKVELIDVSTICNVSNLRKYVAIEAWQPAAVKLGHDEEFLSSADVIALELERYKRLTAVSEAEEALALLLSDAIDEVPSLLDDACRSVPRALDPVRTWMFVGLSDIRERWDQVSDPWSAVSVMVERLEVVEPYDVGDDYLSLLPYWPASDRPTGKSAMLSRLDERLRLDGESLSRANEAGSTVEAPGQAARE